MNSLKMIVKFVSQKISFNSDGSGIEINYIKHQLRYYISMNFSKCKGIKYMYLYKNNNIKLKRNFMQ